MAKEWGKIERELDKCALLCQNCHRKHHWQEDVAISLQKENALKEVRIRKVPWLEFSKEEKELSALMVSKRRREKKIQFLKEIGSECSLCGYSDCPAAIDFHHVDPLEKDFTLSDFVGKGEENIRRELEKCEVVCANCHGEIHGEERIGLRKSARENMEDYRRKLKKHEGHR